MWPSTVELLHKGGGIGSAGAAMAAPNLVPRPFLCGRGEREEGRKGLVNNSTLTRIHGCIPAVNVDEGKRECQVGVSRE